MPLLDQGNDIFSCAFFRTKTRLKSDFKPFFCQSDDRISYGGFN